MILAHGIYQLCYSEQQASGRPANLGFVENLSTILTHPYLLSSTLNGSGQHPENLLQCAPFFLSCTSPDQLFCCSQCHLHWLVCVTFEWNVLLDLSRVAVTKTFCSLLMQPMSEVLCKSTRTLSVRMIHDGRGRGRYPRHMRWFRGSVDSVQLGLD